MRRANRLLTESRIGAGNCAFRGSSPTQVTDPVLFTAAANRSAKFIVEPLAPKFLFQVRISAKEANRSSGRIRSI